MRELVDNKEVVIQQAEGDSKVSVKLYVTHVHPTKSCENQQSFNTFI
jgi:hypothetical protein